MSKTTPVTPEQCQNKRTHLKECIENIYKTKDFFDVTFTVGRKVFKAHKLILGSRCTEFRRLLLDDNALANNIVEDESVTETGFEILLRFIYTDTLGTDDKLSIVQAYLAADYYKQKKLKLICEELMQTWSLTVEEICELLNVSVKISRLRERCLDFIKSNAREVISSEHFFKLNYEALIAILDFDALKDVESKESITKVIEWIRNKCKNTDDMAVVRDYCDESSPPLLGKLKIEALQLQELVEVFSVKYKNLLSPTEMIGFMQYTHTKNRADLPDLCKT